SPCAAQPTMTLFETIAVVDSQKTPPPLVSVYPYSDANERARPLVSVKPVRAAPLVTYAQRAGPLSNREPSMSVTKCTFTLRTVTGWLRLTRLVTALNSYKPPPVR